MADLRVKSSEPIPPVNVSHAQIDDLVRIAYDEAVHLARDILSISAPKTPSFIKQPLLHIAQSSMDRSEHSPADTEGEFESDDEPEEDKDNEVNSGDDEPYILVADSDDNDSDNPEFQQKLNRMAGFTAKHIARYSVLSDDLDDILTQHDLLDTDISLPLPSSVQTMILDMPSPHSLPLPIKFSKILDPGTSKLSISASLKARRMWQSATAAKSERTVKLSEKFTRVVDSTDGPTKKMLPKEASHRLRIAQDLNIDLQKQQKQNRRQKRWLEATEQITKILGSIDGDIQYFIFTILLM